MQDWTTWPFKTHPTWATLWFYERGRDKVHVTSLEMHLCVKALSHLGACGQQLISAKASQSLVSVTSGYCLYLLLSTSSQTHWTALTQQQAHTHPWNNFPFSCFPGTKTANKKTVFPTLLSLPILLHRLQEESFPGSSMKRKRFNKEAWSWTGRTDNLEGKKERRVSKYWFMFLSWDWTQ